MVQSTYRRDRQEVMAGGYGPVIERRFSALVEERLGKSLARSLERDVFPLTATGQRAADPLYAELFDQHYENRLRNDNGGARGGGAGEASND